MVIEFISLLLTMAALEGMTGALAPFSYQVNYKDPCELGLGLEFL
jgi:hypothetical protein